MAGAPSRASSADAAGRISDIAVSEHDSRMCGADIHRLQQCRMLPAAPRQGAELRLSSRCLSMSELRDPWRGLGNPERACSQMRSGWPAARASAVLVAAAATGHPAHPWPHARSETPQGAEIPFGRLLVETGDPEKYSPGAEVAIGAYRFRCSRILGRGSFSEVWSSEVVGGPEHQHQEVALKDITCQSQADLQQALLEAALLERFQGAATAPPGRPPAMRVPRYVAHRVDRRPGSGSWRVRMAMARLPGESLDSYLQRPPPVGQDGPASVRRGCALAAQLLRQLGPTLAQVSAHAWHRDVNSHNILVSDALDGGRLRACGDAEEAGQRASFWLIDFGLAVDSATWPAAWPSADVAGDCRYWPPSSFLMSLYGPDETAAHRGFCNQYKTRLDITGLGLAALEILCSTALASSYTWGADGLRGSWRRLFQAWERYREDVTRWHTMIFHVFSTGGDVNPLYQKLGQERVVDKMAGHMAKMRSLLHACTMRTEDVQVRSLLNVLAEMIDEQSSLGLEQAVEALDPNRFQPIRALSFVPVPPQAAGAKGQLAPACHRRPRHHFAGA